VQATIGSGYVPREPKPGPTPKGKRIMSVVRALFGVLKPRVTKRAHVGLALLALGGVAMAQGEPGATMRGSIGPAVVLSEKAAAVPTALVEVDAPVALGRESVARVMALLRISGVAGDEKFSVGDASTFNSAEFELWIKRRIGSDYDGGATYVYMHGGGAVLRDSHGAEPYQRNPLWYSVGLTLERRESKKFPKRWVSIGYGHSDISSPPARKPGSFSAAARDAKPADLIASGAVELGGPSKSRFIISADVHRGLYGPRATTQVRLSTTMSWGE